MPRRRTSQPFRLQHDIKQWSSGPTFHPIVVGSQALRLVHFPGGTFARRARALKYVAFPSRLLVSLSGLFASLPVTVRFRIILGRTGHACLQKHLIVLRRRVQYVAQNAPYRRHRDLNQNTYATETLTRQPDEL